MAQIKGGQKFKQVLADIAKQLNKAGLVEVGFMSNATYPDGMSVAAVAAFNEFGVPSHGQPPRPFFRNMIVAKSPEWPAAVVNLLKSNNNDARKTLELMGAGIKGQLQQSIVDLHSPPLKPSTIKAKGHAKPLIDTGQMLNSVDYRVSYSAYSSEEVHAMGVQAVANEFGF